MPDDLTRLPWTHPDWLADAHDWIRGELDRLGRPVTGPIEQPHVRPWSTVLTVPTAAGAVYFKASAPTLAHEAALTEALWHWHPDCMVPVLAADRARGWLLLEDAGPMLRAQMHSPADLRHWEIILPRYAELQQAMIGRADELLALGVLDRRPAGLPVQLARLLDDRDMLHIDQPDGLSAADYDRLRDLLPAVEALARRLAACGLPDTLHHDDFHDGNIFVSGARYAFSDWGESGVAHPFFTLLVTLRSTAYRLKLEDDDPAILRLRDRYLDCWTDFLPRDRLGEAFALARRLAMIARALTWYHIVAPLDPPLRDSYVEAVAGWLQEFLDAQATAPN